MTLGEAVCIIANNKNLSHNKEVMMIEYEDGSFMKFNYRLNGETDYRFVDLSLQEKKKSALRSIEVWLDHIDGDSEDGRDYARLRITEAYKTIINHQ